MSLKFIVKHSKASENYYSRGHHFELKVSGFLKSRDITLIVIWPKLLRERNLGQVDLVWIKKNKLVVCECKTGSGVISFKQRARLTKSAVFLGNIFKKEISLVRIVPFAKKENGDYPFKVKVIKDLG